MDCLSFFVVAYQNARTPPLKGKRKQACSFYFPAQLNPPVLAASGQHKLRFWLTVQESMSA